MALIDSPGRQHGCRPSSVCYFLDLVFLCLKGVCCYSRQQGQKSYILFCHFFISQNFMPQSFVTPLILTQFARVWFYLAGTAPTMCMHVSVQPHLYLCVFSPHYLTLHNDAHLRAAAGRARRVKNSNMNSSQAEPLINRSLKEETIHFVHFNCQSVVCM